MSTRAAIGTMVIGGIAFLAGCRRPDPAHLAEADRLLAGCDSLSAGVNAIDVAAYRRMDSIFGTQRAWFEDRFRDTLDTTTALILGNYHRAMNGPLQDVIDGYDRLKAGIDSTRHRMLALHHDLSEALLEPPAADSALRDGSVHLLQWRLNTGVLQQGARVVSEAWDLHHTSVDSMMAATDSTTSIP